jgi:hypothetical protein
MCGFAAHASETSGRPAGIATDALRLGSAFRPAPAPGDGTAPELLRLVVGHVQLADALPGIAKRDPYCCALTIGNFDT